MTRKLAMAMHILVLAGLSLIAAAFVGDYIDSLSRPAGDFGLTLVFAMVYIVAAAIGFIGWLISIFILLSKSYAGTKHRQFALLYLLTGVVLFFVLYFLFSAS